MKKTLGWWYGPWHCPAMAGEGRLYRIGLLPVVVLPWCWADGFSRWPDSGVGRGVGPVLAFVNLILWVRGDGVAPTPNKYSSSRHADT